MTFLSVLALLGPLLLLASLAEAAGCRWTDSPGKTAMNVNWKRLYGSESLDDCKALCEAQPWCLGVNFQSGTYHGDTWTYCNGIEAEQAGFELKDYSKSTYSACERVAAEECYWVDGKTLGSEYGRQLLEDGEPPRSFARCKALCEARPGCPGVEWKTQAGNRCFAQKDHKGQRLLDSPGGSVCVRGKGTFPELLKQLENEIKAEKEENKKLQNANTDLVSKVEAFEAEKGKKPKTCSWITTEKRAAMTGDEKLVEADGSDPTTLEACQALCEARDGCSAVEIAELTPDEAGCWWYQVTPTRLLVREEYTFSACERVC